MCFPYIFCYCVLDLVSTEQLLKGKRSLLVTNFSQLRFIMASLKYSTSDICTKTSFKLKCSLATIITKCRRKFVFLPWFITKVMPINEDHEWRLQNPPTIVHLQCQNLLTSYTCLDLNKICANHSSLAQ